MKILYKTFKKKLGFANHQKENRENSQLFSWQGTYACSFPSRIRWLFTRSTAEKSRHAFWQNITTNCCFVRYRCICKQFRCVCGSMVNIKATHGLSCNIYGRYGRHSALNGIIKRAISSAGFYIHTELPRRHDNLPIEARKVAGSGRHLQWQVGSVLLESRLFCGRIGGNVNRSFRWCALKSIFHPKSGNDSQRNFLFVNLQISEQ